MGYTPNLDLSKVAQGAEDWQVDWGTNCDILDAVIGKIKFTDGSGGSLTAGMVVYISAANTVQEANATDDTKPGVAICRTTDGETAKLKVFGIAKDVVTIGAGDIVAGDEVWLSTTAGKVTKTKPTGETNLQQLIGRAITAESSDKVDMLLMIETTGMIDWSEIINRPSSSVSDIDDAVDKRHTQDTDKIIKDADGDTWHKTEKTSDIDELEGAVKGVTCYKFHDSGILDLPKQSGCSVYLSANQSITDSVLAKVEFDTKIYDIQNDFDSTTNYRFTAPVDGKYLVIAFIKYYVTADLDKIYFRIYVNDAANLNQVHPASSMYYSSCSIAKIFDLGAGDYVEIKVLNDDNDDVIKGSNVEETSLQIQKLA